MQTSLSTIHRSQVEDCCENRLLNESWLSETLFAVWIFVSELALFCTSSGQLITDVYKHHSRCLFNEQRYFLKDWGVCSEAFTVLQVVVGLLNICTKNVISVRKPETHFWCDLAAEWLFKKNLPPANVKVTSDCRHCAVPAQWEGSTLFHLCLNLRIRTFWFQLHEIAVFSESPQV